MTAGVSQQGISPQGYAKTGGLLYIVIIILGISSEFFFRDKMIVAVHPSATAANIESSLLLWRLGIAAEYVSIICTIILAMIYFFLLRPVHKNLNLLSTFFRMVSIIVQVVAVLSLLNAVLYLTPGPSLANFTTEQRYAMAAVLIKSHSNDYGISLFFLGCCFLVHGHLIFRSGFLPKWLGVLIQIAGISYICNGFVLMIAPAAAGIAFKLFFLPVFLAETSLAFWLLIKGVSIDIWKKKYLEQI